MIFVKTNQLKQGMRLARPIYNKDGVLLYERNSKLSLQGINSIKAFGLIGLFILEPAEPVPPMSPDDLVFERFQTMTVFALQEELNRVKDGKRGPRLQIIVNNIVKAYGHLDKKINFIQSLRSKEDYIYKHALNVGMLCAMMTNGLNMKLEDRVDTIIAALVHDVGKLSIPKEMSDRRFFDKEEEELMNFYQLSGFPIIEKVFSSEPNIKRICIQTQKALENFQKGEAADGKIKMVLGAKILLVAETYDTMTAMRLNEPPESEVTAIKYLLNNPTIFETAVVDSLLQSINILVPGISVELNTGEKAIVIVNNDYNILRPVVLGFTNNNIMDLSNYMYSDIEIVDIMKTMDNRYIIDTKTLQANGISVETPEEAKIHDSATDDMEEYVPGQFL